jgi:hypothetical protein
LVTEGGVAASTQNVALSALLFLCRQVLKVHLPGIENIERARCSRGVPVVFTRNAESATVRGDGQRVKKSNRAVDLKTHDTFGHLSSATPKEALEVLGQKVRGRQLRFRQERLYLWLRGIVEDVHLVTLFYQLAYKSPRAEGVRCI